MNRKILALLLVSPVLVFAANKVIGFEYPTTPVKAQVYKTEDIHINTDLSNEEVIAEMKASIRDKEGREKAYYASNIISLWDTEKLKPEVVKFIKTNVIKKLEQKNICSIDLQRSFSRCPSGYEAVVVVQDNMATNEGWMISNSGCDQNPIAMFRYDFKASTVEAKVSDKVGFVPIDEFLKIYKSAQAGLAKT